MPQFRFRPSVALGALCLALLFPACGNDPNPKPLHTQRPDGSPWLVRYVSIPDDIRSLDPQVSYDMLSFALIDPVQDNLLTYHPMKTDPYEVMPQMLATMPERTIEPDGKVTHLCRLKPKILFHDDPCFPGGKGREVIAEDVQYSFQRLCDPKNESPFFGNLSDYVIGMTEAHDDAKKAGRFDYDSNRVAGIEVIDRYTFKLRLSRVYPQIQYWLAMACTSPVAREAVEYYDGKGHPDGPNEKEVVRPLFKFHAVGTGPFRIQERVAGQRYRLVRVEGYHTEKFPAGGWPPEYEKVNRPLAGRALPLVDELQITVFRELLPPWLLGRQGYLDRIAVQKAATSAAITSTAELSPKLAKRGMKLGRALEVSTFFMHINMQDPLLGSNKKLRQALACAFDPQGFSDMMYGGVAPVAQQLVPPGIFGHQKDFQNPYGPNLRKAHRLLAEAGYPDGRDPKTGSPLEISMDVVATGGEERQLHEYEQRQLEQLGIRVRMIENTFARMMEKHDQGNFQLGTGSGWGADYPDAENFFFLFISSQFPPVGKNSSRYVNPEFDRLFTEMATMENTPERFERLKKMNDILLEDCPLILSFHKALYIIMQPWAPNTHLNMINPASIYGGMRYLPVDPALRERKRREWNPKPKWPIALFAGCAVAGLAYGIRLNRRRVV